MALLSLVLILCVAGASALVAGAPSEQSSRMCMIYCQYGFRRNTDGHLMCVCKKSPCDEEAAPLEGYFCGRGPNRRECPSTHKCTIAPNDAYAVCCPRAQQPPERNPNKPGVCPQSSSHLMGICIARCTDDSIKSSPPPD
ncbi:unnamed protein product [Rotaria sp. Silwood1]|nr:unnamed protein product [Rotaria sp. Silwood1]CAF3928441.1 unnamed protein product [Rotaria sp. Silwood1]CAF4886498.1 unnamed protein product [Rotaria sp. Silwood1]CAF4988848.1 unnamed protein product [Rotaria sp. Silwood1]CAF5084361.1 unnamed protein product [Rotaria sp. Silwood1]